MRSSSRQTLTSAQHDRLGSTNDRSGTKALPATRENSAHTKRRHVFETHDLDQASHQHLDLISQRGGNWSYRVKYPVNLDLFADTKHSPSIFELTASMNGKGAGKL